MITNGILPQTPGAVSFRRVLGGSVSDPSQCATVGTNDATILPIGLAVYQNFTAPAATLTIRGVWRSSRKEFFELGHTLAAENERGPAIVALAFPPLALVGVDPVHGLVIPHTSIGPQKGLGTNRCEERNPPSFLDPFRALRMLPLGHRHPRGDECRQPIGNVQHGAA